MKKILITGANSYIGTSFEKYIKENYPNEYAVDTVDMIDGSWREKDFSGYDSVFHVAGIAHQKETKENAPLYYKVNRDLAIETAEKAKADGVKHFVFLSSMSIYGMNTGIITKETAPAPKSNYGKSKAQAEEGIRGLSSESFTCCIIRPPMIYGKGCKGNFQTVVKLVHKLPVFPRCANRRSLIYIENLCSFVKLMIDTNAAGVFMPQNAELVSTLDMAMGIANATGKHIYYSYLMGGGVKLFLNCVPMLQKAFGDLQYQNTEEFNYEYCLIDNEESFKRSV